MSDRTDVKHFNAIADRYYEQIKKHIREHLIHKWWANVSCYFACNCKVIDIGCGDGTNVFFLMNKGVDAIGVDPSKNLILRGKERYEPLKDRIFEGDALSLQFGDNTFDVAIFIGVLHHIRLLEKQLNAIKEALRIVKSGGVVIIWDTNIRNPLFRFTWNYIFPLTSKIDKFGGENWIQDSVIVENFKAILDHIYYFTFIPSFTPKIFLPMMGKMEKILENSKYNRLAAHYVIVLKKS